MGQSEQRPTRTHPVTEISRPASPFHVSLANPFDLSIVQQCNAMQGFFNHSSINSNSILDPSISVRIHLETPLIIVWYACWRRQLARERDEHGHTREERWAFVAEDDDYYHASQYISFGIKTSHAAPFFSNQTSRHRDRESKGTDDDQGKFCSRKCLLRRQKSCTSVPGSIT